MEAHANDRRVKQIEGALERIVEEIKPIEEKEKINEEYTLVTMSELQPRMKVFEKKTANAPKNEKNEKTTQNQNQKPIAKGDSNNKTEKKNEFKDEKEKKDEKSKNPNNPYDVDIFLPYFSLI